MMDIVAGMIFGVCFTICAGVWMVWFKLYEIKEVLNEIADMIDTESEDKHIADMRGNE